jgi:hypothetical protein
MAYSPAGGARTIHILLRAWELDGHADDQHRVRRTSSKEYYHLCGCIAATEERRPWRQTDGPEWNEVINQMPTVKKANLNLFLDAVRYRLDNYAAIVEPFDSDFRYRRVAFTTYTNWQKDIHELCRRLTFGSKKYGRNPSLRHANPTRAGNVWRPASPLDRTYEFHNYIIAFGNGSFGNMLGKRPTPTKKIYKHLYQLSGAHNGRISVIKVDQYLTSKICAVCDQRTVIKLCERRDFDQPWSNNSRLTQVYQLWSGVEPRPNGRKKH